MYVTLIRRQAELYWSKLDITSADPGANMLSNGEQRLLNEINSAYKIEY